MRIKQFTHIYDSHTVAQLTSRSRDWINRIAKRDGLGVMVGNRYKFTAEEVETIKRTIADGKRGNPNFGKK